MKKVEKLIKKSKTIINAYAQELPLGEKWYEDRLSICTRCPHNSENVVDKSFSQKFREGIGFDSRYCTACKCPIDVKASIKAEECGIVELGQAPLWDKLEFEDNINKGVSMINLSPERIILKRDVNRFYLDAAESEEKAVEFKFRVFTPITYVYKSAIVGCSCTVAQAEVVDENNLDFNVRISTLNFREGIVTEKNVQLLYTQGNIPRSISLKFLIIKK